MTEQAPTPEKSRKEATEILLKVFLQEAGFEHFDDAQLARQARDLSAKTGLPADQIEEILRA